MINTLLKEVQNKDKNQEEKLNKSLIKSTNELNYLEYLLPEWKLINESIIIQNRYNDIYSFTWNSPLMDIRQELDQVDPIPTEEQDDNTHNFFYPASLVKMPEWQTLGQSIDYDVYSGENNTKSQFLISSAPLHNSLVLNDEMKIPQTLDLYQTKVDQNENQFVNLEDLNMIYFFKLIFNYRVRTIIAICSDPTSMTPSEDNIFTVGMKKKNVGVMNKCHLYWRIKLNVHIGSKLFSISSQKVSEKANDLYNTYQMTITDVETQKETKVKVFVLTNWPDHEELPKDFVPDLFQLYDYLYKKFKKNSLDSKENVIVHCSAGVGRTGTTILGYQMYSQMREMMEMELLEASSSFYEVIKNYTSRMNWSDEIIKVVGKHMEKNQLNAQTSKINGKSFADLNQIILKSKLFHYLMDNMVYYRFRRIFFVQTLVQFEFLIHLAEYMSYEAITASKEMNGLENEKIVVSYEHSDNIFLRRTDLQISSQNMPAFQPVGMKRKDSSDLNISQNSTLSSNNSPTKDQDDVQNKEVKSSNSGTIKYII